jgi:hypothetical protein
MGRQERFLGQLLGEPATPGQGVGEAHDREVLLPIEVLERLRRHQDDGL